MIEVTTVTMDRQIACSKERLFQVMTTRELREKWSAPDDSSVVIIDSFDCRPGGREETRCGPKEAPEFNTTSLFHVVTPELFTFTESLVIGGQLMSVSLCNNEITEAEKGCALKVTLQITSLVGAELFDDYGNGWSAALDKLAVIAEAGVEFS